jgi:putative glycosyltransferase
VRLSIVTSVYRSEGHLEEFHRRMTAAAERVTDDLEIVYVNDGSPDRSVEVCRRLLAGDARVAVVDLAHNVGQHEALLAGLAHADGDRVFLIDCDLEEPPEVLTRFWEAAGVDPAPDAVCGFQPARRAGLDRAPGSAYYRMLGWVLPVPVPRYDVLARLLTRRFVERLLESSEHQANLDVLTAGTGLRQVQVPVEKRRLRPSTYTFSRRARLVTSALLGARGRKRAIVREIHRRT